MSGLSVVIAVQHAQRNLPAIVERLDCARHPDVEFLVCHTPDDPDVPRLLPGRDNVRVIAGERGALIPHLWRDGIRAARHPAVAVTTAHCIPDERWLLRLLATDLAGAAGVGGVFENDPRADAKSWAIFMQRYAVYARPQAARTVTEIAADNAVYRREDIVRHADLLDHGFWEPSFHARFRAAGEVLRLDPELRVFHHNLYAPAQYLRQRSAHGREFGLERARRLSWPRRAALLALSPLLPLVFLRKLVAAARRAPECRARLPLALPWLCVFLLGWGWGEARGYAESLVRR